MAVETFWLKLLVIFENPVVMALFIFIFFLILAKLILLAIDKFIRSSKRTEWKLDELIIKKTEFAFSYVIVLFGLKIALKSININDGVLHHIVNSVIIIIVSYIAITVSDIIIYIWGTRWARHHKSFHEDVIPLMHNFIRIIIVVITFIVLLQDWGINIGPLVASVGIIGLALALGVQDPLKNIFGGISLILDKTFKVHDFVKLETGEVGEIEDIGLRTTRIKTLKDEYLVVPNAQLSNLRIINYTKIEGGLRVDLNFTVKYGANVDKVESIVLKSFKGMRGVLTNPAPIIRFMKINDNSLEFTAYLYIDNYKNSYAIKNEALKRIYNTLLKNRLHAR